MYDTSPHFFVPISSVGGDPLRGIVTRESDFFFIGSALVLGGGVLGLRFTLMKENTPVPLNSSFCPRA